MLAETPLTTRVGAELTRREHFAVFIFIEQCDLSAVTRVSRGPYNC